MKDIPTEDIIKLIHDIKVNELSSYTIATKTLKLFRKIVASNDWNHAEGLMKTVRQQGHVLQAALPQECVAANLVRRILKITREEFESIQFKDDVDALTKSSTDKLLTKITREEDLTQAKVKHDDSQTSLSLHKLVTQTSECNVCIDYSKPKADLREAIIDHLQEIETELETSSENMCAQAEEHIHSSEVILTLGHSRSIDNFLKRAIKKRQNLTIIIAECAPACRGHNLAASLSNVGNVEIIVIPDSSIFAMMSRVNKVIIGTHSVLANGGLRAACGANTVALAAKHYSVPVIVLAPMYKLTPVYLCSFEQDAFNLLGCAGDVIPYNSIAANSVKVYSPIFDYVPPELVTVFISNMGGHAPSYVYRLLSELYHPDDYEI